ncbi:acyl-CoA dehydrogenase family protein [Streptomyces sp. ISL-11]|uniref:acyl-CoA dehydrogenase family protein n=1 Tax=Streptomyces sp. ISL-11 TaxID=2819174 RepID=UPI001BE62BB1|nr:acyl-CoA dehydrogenase family protein [Streptomyces sp. ISL-11]MBT2383915.1 acyl-CoA dehydrogenase family protein [Streptomyces sp. ISL-11]
MDVTLAPEHQELLRHVTETLDDELAPLIRRMADRPRHGADPDNAAIRAMVWQALTEMGALRLNQSPAPGDRRGLSGLAVLAERLGEVLYQGPLLDTVLTSEALLRCAPGPGRDRFLKEIAAGASVAAAVRDGAVRPYDAPLATGTTGDTVSAERRFVAFAAEADWLLIPGLTADGTRRTALVRRDDPTVHLRRHEELGRGELYAVRLADTPVTAWLAPVEDPEATWQELIASARTLQAAYLVGLARGALRLGTDRLKERRQFGGALARQQSPAFLLARLATRIDAARLLTRQAAWEADTDRDHRLTAGQALAMAATLARDTGRDVLHLHGAHGMTDASDAQLFFRRAAVESLALGSPARVRADVLPLLMARRPAD